MGFNGGTKMKKIYWVVLLLALVILIVACAQQPDVAYQGAQNAQPAVGGGCGV